jgi:DNA-binding MarR family transcriptional regulator
MSLKQDFINYVESNFDSNPMPESLTEYWAKFKGNFNSGDTPQFTENGKKILAFLQQNTETRTWKSKEIAEGMFVASRTVSGAIRKLVSDGYVEKVGQDPVIYSITEKGINTKIDND